MWRIFYKKLETRDKKQDPDSLVLSSFTLRCVSQDMWEYYRIHGDTAGIAWVV